MQMQVASAAMNDSSQRTQSLKLAVSNAQLILFHSLNSSPANVRLRNFERKVIATVHA